MQKLAPLFVILISSLAQFVNLFGYPAFEGDEGFYVSQGWWLTQFGQITPYTYWYDHFPLGWLQIGLWQHLTGGPFAFGLAIFSGRVFTSLLVIVTSLVIYYLVKHLSKNPLAALLSVIIFTLSPLALTMHRLVYLDNISVFWMILSLYLLLTSQGRLFRQILSALFLGIATLSKESALIFAPGYFAYLYFEGKGENKGVSLTSFSLTYFFCISFFPLMALLKGEFFPGPGHVSLLETILYQAARGTTGDLMSSLNTWLDLDFVLIFAGVWGLFITIFSKKEFRFISIFAILYILFLIRGKIVLDFYLIPLIPFLAITISLALNRPLSFLPKKVGYVLLFIFSLLLFFINFEKLTNNYTGNQFAVIQYIHTNLPKDASIATDFNFWLDLKFDYPHTESYYHIENDPGVSKKIDYIILNSGMNFEINSKNYQIIQGALENSTLIKDFTPLAPKETRIGDKTWLQIYKVNL